MVASTPKPPAIELIGIDKRFGAVHANKAIDLKVEAGSIHGIVGENGAGKSTLMSILYGFYQADSGSIVIDGRQVSIPDSAAAIAHGIGMVHQHFMLVDNFTVLENVILGAEGGARIGAGLATARRRLAAIEAEYGLAVDPDAEVGDLPVGLQQRVEIVKALYRDARILVLDEPTSVLTPQETEHLFKVLRALRAQGRTVLLITHKLHEIMAITDRVSVMRQGAMVAHRETNTTSAEELSELMVGRKVPLVLDKAPARPGAVALAVRGLKVADRAGIERVHGVDFSLNKGEIVGIAGVSGNGQSELLEALAGILRPTSGEIAIDGQPVFPAGDFDVSKMKGQGLAHVPEDRQGMGMVTAFAARETAILGYHQEAQFRRPGWLRWLLDWRAIDRAAARDMADYDVRPPNPLLRAASFSGGNQQKIVMAREVERNPDVLLVGQPSRGVDIGATKFIHSRLLALRDAGKAILLVSVELDEIMSLSDRILVMFDGRIMGEVSAAEADERLLGLLMAGVDPKAPKAVGQAS